MALGRSYSFVVKSKVSADYFNGGRDEFELGSVRYTRGLGRKRIVISNEFDESSTHNDSAVQTPSLKRQCSETFMFFGDFCSENDKSALESLPQDVLIRILCGVDHDDLKQLFNVSKSIREAVVIAKEFHFAYSTPTKTRTFRTPVDSTAADGEDEVEAPNAPRQPRPRRPVSRKILAEISVSLFD